MLVLGMQHHTCTVAVEQGFPWEIGDGFAFSQEADLNTGIQIMKADALERSKM